METIKRLLPRQNFRLADKGLTRIVDVCSRRGYHISFEDAETIWNNYGILSAQGYEFLPELDEDVFKIINEYAYVAEW